MPGNYGSYSSKQKKIAKMSGNKKKMEASDFAKLRMFKKKKKKASRGRVSRLSGMEQRLARPK